jgi:hypothetical protein
MLSVLDGRRGGGYRSSGIRRCAVWLFTLVQVLQSGCASLSTGVPQTAHQGTLGKVAIVSPDREPELSFEGFSHGRAAGAGKGAGSTFLSCLGQLDPGTCSGEFCGAVFILWIGVCGVAGVVGGVAGAVSASPAATVQQAEADLTAAVTARTIQTALRDRITTVALANATPLTTVIPGSQPSPAPTIDYRPLAAEGIDSVLEVTVTRAGTQGTGINAPVQIYMEAHVRLVRSGDNAEKFARDYRFEGNRLTLAEWSADRGKRLLQALEEGYAALASQIYDSVFLLYHFPDQGAHSAGLLAVAFGLGPIEPRTRGQLSGDTVIGPGFEWTTVTGVQPTLRWQSFPRKSDLLAAPDEMGRVKHVRYDLLISREHELAPAGIVYRRVGLPSAEHRLATPLAYNTRYFWTVRARFELDGRERVTEWGTTHYLARDRLTSPSSFSYRFRTP